MKLMIVEDNPHMCQLLKQLMSDLAEVIVQCSDGEQAVAAYAVEQPDWTLMDLQMERLSGIEATRRIRAAWPEARIVILTEHDDQHWRAAARQAGGLRLPAQGRPVGGAAAAAKPSLDVTVVKGSSARLTMMLSGRARRTV